ncbi:MAG: prepilin-type N-terminal cleavage/methylation domain-containing protein [Gemmatimonadales bacterium]
MSRRSGFTLIEVMVAIVLTAVVSLLVYGAARAARDTQARIAEERTSLQSALAMRLLLQGALAGAQTTFLAADTVFALENRVSGRGVPQDRLTFVASGDLPPLSPGADWTVSLEPTPLGLRLVGGPMGIRTPTRLLALLPGVTGLAVRVRDRGVGAGWREEWNFLALLPEAVELTYWTDSGAVGLPLTVSLALGTRH